MDITLNDQEQKISGKETITYVNNSPDMLEYLWLQLDQNVRAKNSNTYKISNGSIESMDSRSLNNLHPIFEGGFNITNVTDQNGNKISYTIHQTMMRINLEKPIKPGGLPNSLMLSKPSTPSNWDWPLRPTAPKRPGFSRRTSRSTSVQRTRNQAQTRQTAPPLSGVSPAAAICISPGSWPCRPTASTPRKAGPISAA